MKKLKFISLSVLCILVLAELVARYLGLDQFPLFMESKEFEYIHRPNQTTRIYGNNFKTNEYSMRSEPINKSDTCVVLLIGDSVLNGGNSIDQDELASTLLENSLNKKLGKKVRVLNISSFSWGPDNIYAYLKKYGTFNADLMIYVCGSGDAYDNMTFEKIVGVSSVHPDKNYIFGIKKLVDKGYGVINNTFKKIFPEEKSPEVKEKNQKFNSGFSDLDSLARRLNIPFLIYLHPDLDEISKKQYSKDGKLIIDFYTTRHRKVIRELNLGAKKEYYLDGIHINAEGQLFISKNLYEPILNYIK
ncbi:hypothetical protein [Spirosoma pollinicola]|uniref:SGNH hydrolase-type esterase domain-containing protein n=1 Tax=Spirosoma pollinicola TaxID=2057025 RepID=A0A2K8Z966_9BACT|nr:hypothetical protein [Spirosoma pollinicola]AUD06423.1 hypothetical protein CWM47_34040 [Spirosoma pollinicola]